VIAFFQGNQRLRGKRRTSGEDNEGGDAEAEDGGMRDHNDF
jgi:hypothetical protein